MPWRAANSLTRPFQSWRISCHGWSNPYLPEDRQRYEATSEIGYQRSVLYSVRCPATKTATGEITASKYRNLFPIDTFLSHNVARWQRNAFDAACKCWSKSCRFLFNVGILNMQPSHLWHDCWSKISISKPYRLLVTRISMHRAYRMLAQVFLAQVFLAFCVFTSFRWGLPATQCRFHRNKLMPWRTHGPW